MIIKVKSESHPQRSSAKQPITITTPGLNRGYLTPFPCVRPGEAAGMRTQGGRGLGGLAMAPHAHGNDRVHGTLFTLVDHQDKEH